MMDQCTMRFDELAKLTTCLRNAPDEAWKSIKYESGLRLPSVTDLS